MQKRSLYILIATALAGIVLPTVLYFTYDIGGDQDHYGSCLVNSDFRFKCGIDQEKELLGNLNNCSDALGCWEPGSSLQFNCFHSIPSAFQYYLEKDVVNGTNDDSAEFQSRPGDHVDNKLINFKSRIHWYSNDVLSIQFADVGTNFPAIPNPDPGSEDTTRWRVGDRIVEGRDEFNVTYSVAKEGFFYVHIGRRTGQKETIFDSRLAPLAFYRDQTIIGTVLPSKYFYGVKGGQGKTEAGATIADGVTTFGQNELPFYMVREKSGNMHGMLLETTKPFLAQVIDGPGIMFHMEGDAKIPFSLKFFVGPTQQDVLTQLSSYMKAKAKRDLYFPPYWGLGLHLCRLSKNWNTTLTDLRKLNRESDPIKTLPPLPYDSDCISQNLRPLFKTDAVNFPSERLDNLTSFITGKSRRILLAQKLVVPDKAVAPSEDLKMFITTTDMKKRLVGYTKASALLNYLSIFNPAAQDWIQNSQFVPPLNESGLLELFSGLALVDNLPRHENASWVRRSLGGSKDGVHNSRIKSNFSSEIWGTVSPTAMHLNPSIPLISPDAEGLTPLKNVSHLEVSNVYGEESLKLFEKISKENGNGGTERTVVTTTSMWTESFLYGAFSGVDVPFTWQGLRDSLSHLLRFFMFTPYGGTPVCGSYVGVEELNSNNSTDQDLCLRWFQLALLLPFVRSTYGEEIRRVNMSRGPLDFNRVYQKHLTRNIQDRYAYNPYYYTLFHDYTLTGIPPILPVSFHFQQPDKVAQETFPILDQFMIGPSLLAAPLVFAGTSRPVYFPPGLWYNTDGELAWSKGSVGGTVTVSALINYTPLFIRDGSIIPTLHNNTGSTAEECRAGPYTLMATYPRKEIRSDASEGTLYLDDGVTLDDPPFDLVYFNLTQTEFNLDLHAPFCDVTTSTSDTTNANTKISTILGEIRAFGFPQKPKFVTCTIFGYTFENKQIVFDAELKVLRLKNLNIDWCEHPSFKISWESPY